MTKENGFSKVSNGNKVPVIITKGWDVKVIWKNKSTNWIPLAEIKESRNITVAEAVVVFKHDKNLH